jgi:hypothetical protein
MSELLNVVFTVGGYVAGQGAEQYSLHQIAQNRQALLSSHEGADVEVNKLGGPYRLVSKLALVGAAVGLSFAEGFIPASGPNNPHLPVVTIIGTHDAQASLNGSGAIEDSIIKSFDQNPNFQAHLVSAHNSTFDTVTNALLDKNTANLGPAFYGANTTPDAVKSTLAVGFTKAPNVKSNSLSQNRAINGAEVIFTDNEPVSATSSQDVIDAARNAGNIPVYIVNVTSQTGTSNQADLQKITSSTQGKYWDIDPNAKAAASNSAQSVQAALQSAVNPNKASGKLNNDTLPWKILTGILGVSWVRMFKNRKKETAIS